MEKQKTKKQVEPTVYQMKVKAMELAIRTQGKPAFSSTVIKAAKAIYEWLKSEE